MAWEFRVGMKVVCVDDEWGDEVSPLVEGRVYEISGVGYGPRYWNGEIRGVGLILDLHQTINPTLHSFDVQGFDARRFRPLRERKTDISVFRALLNTNEKKVEA